MPGIHSHSLDIRISGYPEGHGFVQGTGKVANLKYFLGHIIQNRPDFFDKKNMGCSISAKKRNFLFEKSESFFFVCQ